MARPFLSELRVRSEEPTYLILLVSVIVLLFLAPRGLVSFSAPDEAPVAAAPTEARGAP